MWFVANLLFKALHETNSPKEELWEESMRLIYADSKQEALNRATQIGKSSEHSYVTAASETVTWSFVTVERLFEVDAAELTDGTEVFSRFLRGSEVESLLKPFNDET
jgi:hypothetical protein